MNWFIDPVDRHIILSSDEPRSGVLVVQSTVVATGFNNDFIVAMKHPNLGDSVSKRLFNRDSLTRDYKLLSASDTAYLSSEDSIYVKEGRWYHISNGWNPPDSLMPYKGVTNYFIIDLREFQQGDREGYVVHRTTDSLRFLTMRHDLGVPETLVFHFRDTLLY